MPPTPASPLGSYRGSSPALERRGWNLALAFQEVFTATVRLRYNRQAVSNAESFRTHLKQALRAAEQEARSGGCTSEDVKYAVFALVAFLDESALSCRNPAFSDWARLPLQAEMFGHQLAGEVFFQELQKTLNRDDSAQAADLLEIYYLCLLLGFKGRYAAGGDLRSLMGRIKEKIGRVRGDVGPLSPRGTIPAEAIRLVPTDPWVRQLAMAALGTCSVAAMIFVIAKIALMSGVSGLATSAPQFVK